MTDNLSDHQPAITITIDDEVHVISIVTIRQLAAGYQYRGDAAKMIELLATATRDLLDEQLCKR